LSFFSFFRAKLSSKSKTQSSFRNPYTNSSNNTQDGGSVGINGGGSCDDYEDGDVPDTQLLTYIHKEKHPKPVNNNPNQPPGSSNNSVGENHNYYSSQTEDQGENGASPYSSAASSFNNVPPQQYYSNHSTQYNMQADFDPRTQQKFPGQQQGHNFPQYFRPDKQFQQQQHQEDVHPFDPVVDVDNFYLQNQNYLQQQQQQQSFDPSKPPLQYKKLLAGQVSGGGGSNASISSQFSLKDFLKSCTAQNSQQWQKQSCYEHNSSATSTIDESTLQDDYESDYNNNQNHNQPQGYMTIQRNRSRDTLPQEQIPTPQSHHHTSQVKTRPGMEISNISHFQSPAGVEKLKINLTEHSEGEHNDELSHFLSSDDSFGLSGSPVKSSKGKTRSFSLQTRSTSPSLPNPNNSRQQHVHKSPNSTPSVSRTTSANLVYTSSCPVDAHEQSVLNMGTYTNPVTRKVMVDKAIQSNKLRHSQMHKKYDGTLNDFAVFTESVHDKTTEMDYDLLLTMNTDINLDFYNKEEVEMLKTSLRNPFLLVQQIFELQKQVILFVLSFRFYFLILFSFCLACRIWKKKLNLID
jgi:hypothetical protein